MPTIIHADRRIEAEAGDPVLDVLLQADVPVRHGCRTGACRSCLMVALEGTVPPAAQAGLSAIERGQGLFLACQCKLEGDLVVGDPSDRLDLPARVAAVEPLGGHVHRVRLELDRPLAYTAGQFLTVTREDGLTRSYSIASLPGPSSLELHVGRVEGGQMSGWFARPSVVGERVIVRGPYGDCCYDPEVLDADTPLLLVGVGTGLAPLWGIVHDALARGHRGSIVLHHGSRGAPGLYLHEALRALTERAPNVRYLAHVLEGEPPPGARRGTLDEASLREGLPEGQPLASHAVFLCGDPGFVQGLRRKLFLAGCSLRKLRADAFVMAPPPAAAS